MFKPTILHRLFNPLDPSLPHTRRILDYLQDHNFDYLK